MSRFVNVAILTVLMVGAVLITSCAGSDDGEPGTLPVGAVDTTPPEISAMYPENGDANVPVNIELYLTFSEQLDPSSPAGCSLKEGDTEVTKSEVQIFGKTLSFGTKPHLRNNVIYTTSCTGVKDLAGNELERGYPWQFTTGSAPDQSPPEIAEVFPAEGSEDVPVNVKIKVFLSKPIKVSSVKRSDCMVMKDGKAVYSSMKVEGNEIDISPLPYLENNTTYDVVCGGNIKDLAGNFIEEAAEWSFTTGSLPDQGAPYVASIHPGPGQTRVDRSTTIRLIFNEPMDLSTVNENTCMVMQGDRIISQAFHFDGVSGVFTPQAKLDANTTYTVKCSADLKDLAGNPMGQDFIWSFTTAY